MTNETDTTTTQLVAFIIEPDWRAVYVDGELYDEGHGYDMASILLSAVDEHDIDTAEQVYVEPDEWRGSPEEQSEFMERYIDFTEGEVLE